MYINKHQIEKLRGALKQYGISMIFNKGFMILDANYTKIALSGKIKGLIYFILNAYEHDYFILIKGIPCCILPDAYDHIIYKRIKNISYKKYQKCRVCKFYTVCPGINQNNKRYVSQIMPLFDRPLDIAIEVNKICNLKCEFCYYNYKDNNPVVSYSKIKKILDEAKGLNIKYVRFTGGEPLLSRNILKILKYAKSQNFYVFLNTNATLVTDSMIKELESCVDNILISLCGYNSYTENIINSSAHLLKEKLNSILKLKRSKIPYIRIGTVISKLLIDNFEKYSILVANLGIKNWELYRPMLSFSTVQNSSTYNLKKFDLIKLLRYMYRLRKSGINVYIANAIPFCISNKSIYKPMMHGAQFDDGHCRLVLDSRGFLKPSYFIDKNLGTDILKAWKRPFLKKMNSYEYLPYNCKHCSYLKWCLGGSRYMAKEYLGDYFSRDPLMEN